MKNRVAKRHPATIPIVVKSKDENNSFWKKSGVIMSVSSVGAGFYLSRECRPGQVLSLLLPLPRNLRRYDHDKELYRVWGLIQHCNPISTENFSGFHIGVAFVGRETPSGYNENPQQSYRICGMGKGGLWKIEQAAASFIARKFQRFRLALDVTLSFFDEEKNLLVNEESSTLDISRGGASVFSKLPVNVGSSIKLSSKTHNFSGLAIVRRRSDEAVSPILHLQFIEAEFPMESVKSQEILQENVKTEEITQENTKSEKNLNLKENTLMLLNFDSILEISHSDSLPEIIEIEELDLFSPPANKEPETVNLVALEAANLETLTQNDETENFPSPSKKFKNRKAKKKAAREAKKKPAKPAKKIQKSEK